MLAFASRPKIVRIPDSQYFDRICGNNVHLMGLYIFFRAVAINGIMKDGVKFLLFFFADVIRKRISENDE
ncbi:hypothetical protein AXF21_07240 [Eubacterium minutum ATCC 700079]|nr:hypothetical protein AXF21_07240 [Eubacterium minutum ATCC 700079]